MRKLDKEEIKTLKISKLIHDVLSRFGEEKMNLRYSKEKCEGEVKAGALLKEVFANIVENSIQHSEGENIYISGEEKENKFICTIEDDGKGIPDEKKEHLFERGYKGEAGGEGEGLGLYFSKKIAESYNGDIEIKDSEGGGARFDIYIPKAN